MEDVVDLTQVDPSTQHKPSQCLKVDPPTTRHRGKSLKVTSAPGDCVNGIQKQRDSKNHSKRESRFQNQQAPAGTHAAGNAVSAQPTTATTALKETIDAAETTVPIETGTINTAMNTASKVITTRSMQTRRQAAVQNPPRFNADNY